MRRMVRYLLLIGSFAAVPSVALRVCFATGPPAFPVGAIQPKGNAESSSAELLQQSQSTVNDGSGPVKQIADERLKVTTGRGSGVLSLYVSLDWSKSQPRVERAIIVFHGGARNAEDYRDSVKRAIESTGRSTNTILIAPRFLEEQDLTAFPFLPTGQLLRWSSGAWEDGQDALAPAPISSFEAIDAILKILGNKHLFPNLRLVVLAGHSGGGQTLQRYAVVGRGEELLRKVGVHVRYVVANPSSYVYFNDERPTSDGRFAPYKASSCAAFNRWKYGVVNSPPYVANRSFREMEDRYVSRDVIYLLGTADTTAALGMDQSCAAEAEGPFRYDRGINYFHYLASRHPGNFKQRLWYVPGVGHDQHKMFNSSCGLSALSDFGICATKGK